MNTKIFLLCASLVACAAPEPRPDNELAVSNTAIEEATHVGAVEYAPDELKQAQTKLQEAEAALKSKNYVAARRFAQQAEADAKLAGAKSQTAKTQETVAEINERVRKLRTQVLRQGNERE